MYSINCDNNECPIKAYKIQFIRAFGNIPSYPPTLYSPPAQLLAPVPHHILAGVHF